ncbi:MAG: hypothetical protein U9M89_00525 [Patescibacteria group bacterium]|nr:hypothetical protein [Patescibacteria group bacterium]
MTKTSYKLLGAILAVILIVRFGPSFVSFAKMNLPNQADFCRTVENVDLDTEIAQRITKFQKDHRQRMDDLSDRQDQQDIKIKSVWKNWLQSKEDNFLVLKSLAKDLGRVDLAESIILTIEKETNDFYTDIEDAVLGYREEVDVLFAGQQKMIVVAVDTYYFSIKSAIDKAASSCENNVNSDLIKAQFKADAAQAKTKLKNAKENLSNTNNQLTRLETKRDSKIRKAIIDFIVVVQNLRSEIIDSLLS